MSATSSSTFCWSLLFLLLRNELVPLLARLLTFGYLATCTFGRGLGIPGTQMTLDGYDNDKSKNPICWTTQGKAMGNDSGLLAQMNKNNSGVRFENPLVPDFTTVEGVKLLSTCPSGFTLKVFVPFDQDEVPEVPRTGQEYNFTVKITVDLEQTGMDFIRDSSFKNNNNTIRMAIQILLCDLQVGGFCSPFVHEQAKARGHTDLTPPGDKHGESHIHSPFVFVEMDDLASNSTTRTRRQQEFQVAVPTIVNEPGKYFIIGAVQFFIDQDDGLLRFDIANAADNRLETFKKPPMIVRVRSNVECAVLAVVGCSCLFLAVCLFECIRHKNHKIMQLCQVYFLIVSLIAGILSVASTILLNPRNDIHCRLYSPLILIPAQLIYSITIGRLWRIQMVVSPFLKEEGNYGQKISQLFSDVLSRVARCSSKPPKTHKLRTVVPWKHMANLVVFFTFPQIALQVVSIVVQPKEKTIEFNDMQTIGREVCMSHGSFRNISSYAFYYLLGTTVLLLILANSWKNLPSLFNEVELIRRSTILNITVLLLGLAVMAVSSDSNIGPEVEYIVWVSVILTMILNSTIALILPKLRMIWQGEEVVVSKLVSDFRVARGGDGLDVSNFRDSSLPLALETYKSMPEMKRFTSSQVFQQVLETEERSDDLLRTTLQRPILLRHGEAPSRLLLVPMLKFEKRIAKINSRVTSGSSISKKEWIEMKKLTQSLAQNFDRMEFDDSMSIVEEEEEAKEECKEIDIGSV